MVIPCDEKGAFCPLTTFKNILIMSAEAIILIVTLVVGGFVTTGTMVWFIGAQFSENRKLMYDVIDKMAKTIMDKLEYHEQHDDIRFTQIADRNNISFKEQSDRIWNLELRNAAKDGILPHEYKKK